MKKRTLKRMNEKEELEKSSDVMVFLTNGVIRRSKHNFVSTHLHYLKVNILIRFILYALFDLIEEGERPYLSLVKERIEDKEFRSKYITYLYSRIQSDKELYAKKKYTPIEIYIKATSRCKIFYQSDYTIAFGRIMNHFIEIVKRQSKEGHWISYIKLTNKGEELRKYYRMGFVF
jgi:hypothetical protein